MNPNKSSEVIASQIIKLLGKLPGRAKSSITDDGAEFAAHKYVNEVLGTKSYFCYPYKSYQKGTVEQVNLWL